MATSALKVRTASASLAPRTSLIDIGWETVAEPAALPLPPVLRHDEPTPARRWHAPPAFVVVPPVHSFVGATRSHRTNTLTGLGPSHVPPADTQPRNERALLRALIIVATVVIGFGVGFGTSFGASVSATLMRLSLLSLPATTPPVHSVKAERPLPTEAAAVEPVAVAVAVASAPNEAPAPAPEVTAPASEVTVPAREVAVAAPKLAAWAGARAPATAQVGTGLPNARASRTDSRSDNPY